MHPEAPTTRPALPEDPPKDRTGPSVPERLAAILNLVRILLGHGRRLTETVTAINRPGCYSAGSSCYKIGTIEI